MIEEEKRIKLYLEDILESLEKIEKYSENLTKSKFKEKDIVIEAILRYIEVFGERGISKITR
ncbi:MAG: nucleotidyltransferase [Candidatus Lokiarchaeota archaeon]|nr:nucleotidyltransferase [Candidatus Lokiarchaeota archaeon]